MIDYSQQYFTIESLEDGNVITFTIPSSITTSDMTSISYSVDGGTNWTTTTINGTAKTVSVSLNRGAKVLWKGIANHLSNANTTYCKFSATNRYIVYGNTMSLLYGDNFYEQTSLPNYSYTFFGLFDESTYLIDASNLILPATTVKTHCYRGMFKGCTSLTAAPELPATTLAGDCYYEMFIECSSLTKAPELLATTAAFECYGRMFRECTSLVTAPNLPATVLSGNYCYVMMFYGCTSLQKAPDYLPAETLTKYCYKSMFYGCSSLTNAPMLPANTLVDECYREMFYGCSSLEEITCLATNISASNCLTNWVRNISATGTFYKAPGSVWSVGTSGIPSGWTISDYYDDYSQKYLTVQSQEDSNTITFSIPAAITTSDMTSISYSVDSGTNWTTTTIDGTAKTISVSFNRGDKILWKGIAQHLSNANDTYCKFSATKQHIVYGNIISLLYGDNFSTQTSVSAGRTFNSLFYNNTTLVDASNLSLTPTTLKSISYYRMFRGCTSLTKAPKLPATALNDTSSVYEEMFYGCTSLTKAPELPATVLGGYCYTGMFRGCTSLTEAPELPATNLKVYCYTGMFRGCTSLTEAPELPATNLVGSCYNAMFDGCTSLKYIKCLATNISASNCLTNWVYGVAASGTFYKHPSMTGWSTGVNGIPSGWTTKDYMMLTVNGNIPAAVKFVQNGVTHDLSYLKFGNNLVWQKTT